MSNLPEATQALLSSEDFGSRLRGIDQLRRLEPAVAFAAVSPLTTDRNTRVRYAAVSMLASIGQVNRSAALELLKAGLVDKEPDVQAAAADALGGLKLTEAFEDIRQLYETTGEWIVQFSVVAALGELGDPRGFDLLTNAIASDNELLCTAAIGALGELGDERAVALILPFASHADWQIRYRVVQALSQFQTPAAHAAIAALANDPVEQVAATAKTVVA
jgi:HEAT repeat protein